MKVWIGCVLAFSVLAFSVWALTACSSDEDEKVVHSPLRFREVERFTFTRNVQFDQETQAVVYEDTKTGVRYLYVWAGFASGGPCLTRLWDK